jgi:DNA mismatch repair protein MutL
LLKFIFKNYMTIKILSNTVINRIAAGEVVERPASVVKELVENSIDAGATKVDVIIENAGRNSITIIDNGYGMAKDDLILAVERHATSKLPEEDINKIDFFGFRGEALPSIASVSRMTITSKPANKVHEHAWSLNIFGGEKHEPIPASLNQGTKIEVKDLFFATPARLKFLKTEKTEIFYIQDILNKIAMANPHVELSLKSDEKEIFHYKAIAENYAERIKAIAGKNFDSNFQEVNFISEDCKISGFVSTPTYNVGTSSEQYFFINKRPVKDRLLSMAIKIAYQDYIPSSRYPIVYLFIELDSHMVDVNVHPAKSEVRFKDSNHIRTCVVRAVKDAIKNISQRASDHLSELTLNSFITQSQESATSHIAENKLEEQTKSLAYITPISPLRFSKPSVAQYSTSKAMFAPIPPMVQAESDITEVIVDNQNFPLGAACGQIHDTYIIAQTDEGMILIDQHAAHERIFYEKLKQQFLNKNIQTKRLFIPEIIELPEHIIEELLSRKQEFEQFGLFIEKFANNSISVNELPAILKCSNVKELIEDLVDDIKEYSAQVSLEAKINHFLATYACHHSIRAGRNLSIKEMNDLLREMERNDHTGQCNHGRPTYIKLSMKDIEKLFERS